jgi:replicative superfamily II helicase
MPNVHKNLSLVQEFLKLEFGDTFPLIELLNYGIGIHHAGLSDDVRYLMEWLFEDGELKILVATTTIAQGVKSYSQKLWIE